MCLAQGHKTVTLVGFEPRTSRFVVDAREGLGIQIK